MNKINMVTGFMHLQFSQERQTFCKWNERLEEVQRTNGTGERQAKHVVKVTGSFFEGAVLELSSEEWVRFSQVNRKCPQDPTFLMSSLATFAFGHHWPVTCLLTSSNCLPVLYSRPTPSSPSKASSFPEPFLMLFFSSAFCLFPPFQKILISNSFIYFLDYFFLKLSNQLLCLHRPWNSG